MTLNGFLGFLLVCGLAYVAWEMVKVNQEKKDERRRSSGGSSSETHEK